MNKGIFLVFIAVVLLLIIAGLFYFRGPKTSGPSGSETPEAFMGEIDDLDLGNLDFEFEAIDAELNQL
jgi:hypothetical protein